MTSFGIEPRVHRNMKVSISQKEKNCKTQNNSTTQDSGSNLKKNWRSSTEKMDVALELVAVFKIKGITEWENILGVTVSMTTKRSIGCERERSAVDTRPILSLKTM